MIKEVTEKHIFLQVPNLTGSRIDGVFVKSKGTWRIPHNLGALRDLHNLGYDVLELGKKLSTEYKQVLDQKSISSDYERGTHLREYQRQDVNFLVNMTYAGVFNEQRTGKTPTMCRVIERIGEKTVVICPASLILNWRDEVRKWTDLNVWVAMGTKAKREKTYEDFQKYDGVLVIGKETARNDIAYLSKMFYHTMIVDEAHFLRNRGSKQSEAICTLGKYAQRKYALTGTPATSSPADVFGILHFLDANKWSSYWQFVERYFNITESHWGGGAKNIGGFKSVARRTEYEELLNIVSVQRKRKDIMQWLPAKQYQTVNVTMSKEQKSAYDEMRTTFEVEEIGLDAPTVITQMLRLRQITSVPSVLGLPNGAKFDFILEYLADNPDEHVLIFSNFSSGLRKLKPYLKKVGIITGEESKDLRHNYISQFQNGQLQVLLCNIEAAGTGLTLDRASTVIFLDRHFNPTQNEQAEDRIVATQEGRNLSSLIIDLVCEGTIDEKILEMVKQKKNITSVANNYRNVRDWLK